MTSIATEIADIVARLLASERELELLQRDEELEDKRGAPSTPAALAKLQQRFGRPLPPSYRAFMEQHDGWADLSGEAKLLSVADQDATWVQERVEELEESFAEFNPGASPFASGCLPIFLGPYESNYAVIDPNSPTQEGEFEVVTYDTAEEEERFASFADYLRDRLSLIESLVASEKNGD